MKIFPKFWIFFFLIVVGIIVLIIIMTNPWQPLSTQTQSQAPEPMRYTTFEGMLDLGGNAIYVENQKAESTFVLVGFVVLSQPGFVVIFNDNGGVPGSVIGESSLLPSGQEHLIVPLKESLVDGQVYYAMLYHDDGDQLFRQEKDTQAVDSQNSVILMTFIATDQAEPETGAVVP